MFLTLGMPNSVLYYRNEDVHAFFNKLVVALVDKYDKGEGDAAQGQEQ